MILETVFGQCPIFLQPLSCLYTTGCMYITTLTLSPEDNIIIINIIYTEHSLATIFAF
jgi:hypothetical protein